MYRQALILLISLLCGGLVQAGPGDRRTSLDEAVSEAREHYPGRVISAETRRRDGREMHNVRILTRDGRVRRFRVDADEDRPPRPGSRGHRR